MHFRPALLALSLATLLPAEDRPFFLQIEAGSPQSAARTEVGTSTAIGTTLGYTLHERRGGKGSFQLEGLFGGQRQREKGTAKEALFVGAGVGIRVHFRPEPSGPYLAAAFLVEHGALTQRPSGQATAEAFTRAAQRVALGWRHENHHVEVFWKETGWDQDRRFAYLGLALGWRL